MRWPLLLALIPNFASACVCGGWPSAKSAWQESPVVFLGRVVEAKPESPTVRVTVEEPFKGTGDDREFVLYEAYGDCTPQFQIGQHIVFYLHKAHGKDVWTAYPCHRSRPIEAAADDLLFLRALPGSAKGTRLSGTVGQDEFTALHQSRARVLPGIHVIITGHGRSIQAVTDANGVYEVYGLVPGRYHVKVDPPKSWKIWFSSVTGIHKLFSFPTEADVELRSNAGESADFLLAPDTLISGRVLAPNGEPMQYISVDLKPVSESARLAWSGSSKHDGTYTVERISPGEYKIRANPIRFPGKQAEFPTVYYPGTFDERKAEIVTVGPGDHLSSLDIRVPKRWTREIVLSGRATFSDGVAYSGERLRFFANVAFSANDGGYTTYSGTNRDGSFKLKILAGIPGTLRGSVTRVAWQNACPESEQSNVANGEYLLSDPVQISGDSDQSNLVLIMPFPSCQSPKKH